MYKTYLTDRWGILQIKDACANAAPQIHEIALFLDEIATPGFIPGRHTFIQTICAAPAAAVSLG
jgi:hypothetical protein